MLKIVIIGYSKMFINLTLGCINSKNKVVGVFYDEIKKIPSILLFFKNIFNPSAEYNLAKKHKLNIIRGRSVNNPTFERQLTELKPDIILVGSWSEKFDEKIIKIAKIAAINTHPSLLPKYRGPNPYIQTILHKEKYSGLTFHKMDSKFDHGDIILQKRIKIETDDTSETLRNKTTLLARKYVIELLKKIENNPLNFSSYKQNNKTATYYKAIDENDVILDFKKSFFEIENQLKAILPFSKMYFYFLGHFFVVSEYKIIKKLSKENIEPNTIYKINNNTLAIAFSNRDLIEFSNLKTTGLFGKIKAHILIKYFIGNKIKI